MTRMRELWSTIVIYTIGMMYVRVYYIRTMQTLLPVKLISLLMGSLHREVQKQCCTG
jgi:hypothetical protein